MIFYNSNFRFSEQINYSLQLIIPHIPTFFNHFSNQIPAGTTSSMYISLFGFAIPINCLWHSHKSSRNPNGISHTSSEARCSCAVP